MKKLIFIFFFSAFFVGIQAQTPWYTNGNGGTTSTNFIGTTEDQPLIFKTNGTERMQLLPNKSFLGIGTENPLATLHLHYPLSMGIPDELNLLQLTTYKSPNGFSIISNRFTNDLLFKHHEQSNFSIEGPGGGFVIAQDGKIGYGTDAPKQKVHLDEGNLLITSVNSGTTNAPNGALLFSDIADELITAKWGIEYLNSTHPTFGGTGLNFRKYGGKTGTPKIHSVLFLSDTEKVGIGTTTPQAKLEVVGTFMAQNADIAGLLCATEIKVNGVNISEMNAILLQKVEELTLYILDLQKQIDELKNVKR
jgi:hypothetical protein